MLQMSCAAPGVSARAGSTRRGQHRMQLDAILLAQLNGNGRRSLCKAGCFSLYRRHTNPLSQTICGTVGVHKHPQISKRLPPHINFNSVSHAKPERCTSRPQPDCRVVSGAQLTAAVSRCYEASAYTENECEVFLAPSTRPRAAHPGAMCTLGLPTPKALLSLSPSQRHSCAGCAQQALSGRAG